MLPSNRITCLAIRPGLMLTAIYIEALPVVEGLADKIWEAWNAEQIDNFTACFPLIARDQPILTFA